MQNFRIPEYLMSTPRLVLLIMTCVLSYMAVKGIVNAEEFVKSFMFVAWYFFWSRWKEEKWYAEETKQQATIHDTRSISDIG